jgi:hypothetical protein
VPGRLVGSEKSPESKLSTPGSWKLVRCRSCRKVSQNGLRQLSEGNERVSHRFSGCRSCRSVLRQKRSTVWNLHYLCVNPLAMRRYDYY